MTTLPFGIGRNEILFSLKAFCASILALWIALQLDLQKPYWAMATAYIVMQPLAAAVTSKAVFRVLGTFLGAAAAVVLVPSLVDAPELLSLALAVWVGLCLFISLLDRTPRSYVAMLAGYGAAIIVFLDVNTPDSIFEVALSRAEEITVGILCAALLSRLVAPQHLGPLLTARLDGWLESAGRWAQDVLSGRPEPQTSMRDRRRLATDTVEMLALTTHLPYDTSQLRHMVGRVQELQQRMTALLPILSGLDDRLQALRAGGPLEPRLAALVEAVGGWIEGPRQGEAAAPAEALRARIDALEAEHQAEAGPWSWRDLLIAALLERLRELVEVWADSLALRAEITGGRARRRHFRDAIARYAGDPHLHVDVSMAAWSGLAVALAILACCAFWIATGWSAGGGAVQMAAIFLSLFAFLDNPVPVMRLFARYTALAMVAVGLFEFTLLPLADSYLELVLLMAPYLLVFGALMATPKYGPLGFIMCVNLPILTMLDARLNLDVATFLNVNIASLVGILAATLTAALLTATGAERSVARLLRANSRDLAHIAEGRSGRDTAALARRLVDRFGLLVQRLVAVPKGKAPHPERALVDLRCGLNMADLQKVRHQLPQPARQAVEQLLPLLAAHFRRREQGEGEAAGLGHGLDDTLQLLAAQRSESAALATARQALVGLRQSLLSGAPDWSVPGAVGSEPPTQWSLAT